jgi:hypothetical protein
VLPGSTGLNKLQPDARIRLKPKQFENRAFSECDAIRLGRRGSGVQTAPAKTNRISYLQPIQHADVRQAAVRELTRGWKEDPGTLALLQDRAARNEHADVRKAAMTELALGWKDDSLVQEFLAGLN